jgi:general secretion pathway protein B
MSYILEALKKAQAERQLGSAPTIHATPIQPLDTGRQRTRSMALLIGLGAVALTLAGAVAWWFQRTPAAPDGAPAAVLAPAPLAPVVVVTPATQPAPGIVAAANPAPYQAAVTAPTPVMGPSAVIARQPIPQRVAPPPPAPVKATPPAPAPAQPVATVAAAPEESLPLMNQLPESQRAGLPQVTFGGYMYSKNPADRLLLIDKTLRHEGEEVAPGLVLERLLPRAAVMNYRGTRYRVPY